MITPKLQPIGKRLIIQPVEHKQGAVLTINNKPTQFKVIAIGPDITHIYIDDIIYISKHQGTEIEHDGQKYFVIDQDSILARC
jgi:co-chaperonin GroES (HSP10)